MEDYIKSFSNKAIGALQNLPASEIAKALAILQATYERDGKVYVFGNGGSLALASHWASDFNKTVFSHHPDTDVRRFQVVRIPTTDVELTAWANDIGYEMIFVEPLRNHIQESDTVVAISSSGNSKNIIKAIDFAKSKGVSVIGLSGFDGGALNKRADAKIFIPTEPGEYEIVEGVHDVVLHMMTKYFKDYFDHFVTNATQKK